MKSLIEEIKKLRLQIEAQRAEIVRLTALRIPRGCVPITKISFKILLESKNSDAIKATLATLYNNNLKQSTILK